MLTRRHALRLAGALPLMAVVRSAAAGPARVYSEDGIAIRGADAVAYFQGGGAVAGTFRERVAWHGAHWLFSTLAHREAFERNPRFFAPRFGGYCAYTLSQGDLAATDPRAWAIHDDRLYLMHSLADRKAWEANLIENIRGAEVSWLRLFG